MGDLTEASSNQNISAQPCWRTWLAAGSTCHGKLPTLVALQEEQRMFNDRADVHKTVGRDFKRSLETIPLIRETFVVRQLKEFNSIN